MTLVDIEQRVNCLEQDMSVVKTKVENVEEDVKGIEKRMDKSEDTMSDIKIMTSTLQETNSFLKEMIGEFRTMIEKSDANQIKYEEKNDKRYVELLKENNKQDIECKSVEISNTKEKLRDIIKILTPIVNLAILGGIAFYLVK